MKWNWCGFQSMCRWMDSYYPSFGMENRYATIHIINSINMKCDNKPFWHQHHHHHYHHRQRYAALHTHIHRHIPLTSMATLSYKIIHFWLLALDSTFALLKHRNTNKHTHEHKHTQSKQYALFNYKVYTHYGHNIVECVHC